MTTDESGVGPFPRGETGTYGKTLGSAGQTGVSDPTTPKREAVVHGPSTGPYGRGTRPYPPSRTVLPVMCTTRVRPDRGWGR